MEGPVSPRELWRLDTATLVWTRVTAGPAAGRLVLGPALELPPGQRRVVLAPRVGEGARGLACLGQLREQVGDFVDSKKATFDEAVNEGRAAAEQARADMVSDHGATEGPAL